ncbi:type VII secretion integral membrane protein EccD [Microbacterium sp.]|uniref:type VII secretion integral membrane protein EccD n=1 Tax=Microbacterium sp. TaxID=51671 RepID=UPI003A8717D9
MSSGVTDSSALLRLSLVHADRRIDIAIPDRLPLVEVLPGAARGLGVLDASLVHGGYRLTRADGTELDPAQGAAAQGIEPGQVLTLTRGHLVSAPKRYDDVVEAVIDATSAGTGSWGAAEATRTATAVSLTLLALCAVLLASQPGAGPVPLVVSGIGALVLLAVTATLCRLRQHDAGIAFGMAAAGFGGLTGYLLARDQPLWGFALAATGTGLALAGGAALLVATRPVEVLVLPVALGVVLALSAGIVGMTGLDPVVPYAIMVAVCGLGAGALPWLTLGSTRIRAIMPSSEAEMFDPPPPVDAENVAARVDAAHRLLATLRVAFALAVLVATPVVAAAGWTGTLLTLGCGTVLMFQSRQSARRASVVVLLAGGTAIIAASTLTAILVRPHDAPVLLTVLVIATALVTGLTLLSDRVRMWLSAAGDTLEVVILALLLPLAALTAGIA